MYHFNETKESASFQFSSELALVDRAIQDCQLFLQGLGFYETSNFKLVLRELLNNAVEHGNMSDPSRSVRCTVERIASSRFRMVVEDEGKGIQPEEVRLDLSRDPTQERSRGFALVNNFSDVIELQEGGRGVTAYISFPSSTTFELREETEWLLVVPSGNLTAGTSEELKQLLRDQVAAGRSSFRFDLGHVEDIDSLSLSVLVLLFRTIEKAGLEARLSIVNASTDLMSLFRLTSLDRIYSVGSPRTE